MASKLLNIFAIAVGFPLLLVPCLMHSWHECESTVNPFNRPVHTIDRWNWEWLNRWYSNPEDGVSGKYALIWISGEAAKSPANPTGVPERVLYMPDANKPRWMPQWLWDSLRAWLWSAWRNNADNLKYQ